MQDWRNHFEKTAVAIAILGYLVSFSLAYRSYGMAEGLKVAALELEEFKTQIEYKDTIDLGTSIYGTYDHLAIEYGWLTWLFGISTLAIAISRLRPPFTMPSLVTAGVSNVFVLYLLRLSMRDKAIMEPYFWEAPRNHFAFQTITYDWLLSGIACFLIFVVTGMAIIHVRDWRSASSTN
jgi:hypothetical protein